VGEFSLLEWLARSALGGTVVLLVAWWGMRRVESPARRQRLGEAGVAAALLVALLSLAPGWIGIRLPTFAAAPPAPAPAVVEVEPPAPFEPDADVWFDMDDAEVLPLPLNPPPAQVEAPAPAPASATWWSWDEVGKGIVVCYAVGAGAMLAWWLGGHIVLWWWLRRAGPIPPRLGQLWAEMAAGRRVRLVVSPRVRVPFSCGLWRPMVVLPATLAGSAGASPSRAEEAALRWVLGHELAHLQRRDPFSAVLFGLGQGLYFFLPWFWKLRHEVRLCQEYLADQAAVSAHGDRLDYADFLVEWARTPGLPAGVPVTAALQASMSISGQRTDLFRRVAMLLKDQVSLEPRCPKRWLLLTVSGLLSLAVLLSGVGPARSKAAADDKRVLDKVVTKQDDKKAPPADEKDPRKKNKDDKKKTKPATGFPDIDELMKRIPQGLDENQIRTIRQQLQQARRQMEEALQLANRMRPRDPFLRRWANVPHEGRLGVRVATPSSTLAAQLDLPKGQGLVIEDVIPDSVAAKAGLKPNDILMEVAGKPVSSQPERLARLVHDLEADKKFDVVVLRKGKKETIKDLTLPKPPAPRVVRDPSRGGAASMLTLQRTGDMFQIHEREGGRSITIRGKLVDGKAQPADIRIHEGRGAGQSYDSLDKVPQDVREHVKTLLGMTEKGVVKVKTKKE
jgi:hypothetical protein